MAQSTLIKPPTLNKPNNSTIIDEFAGDDYAPTYQPLPYLQILNHRNPEQSGFFISSDNATAVNFQPPPEWQSYEAYFYFSC